MRDLKIIITIGILSGLIGCTKMTDKKFVSNQGWLTFDYPSTWDQSEEDEGTYLFMDNDNWKGNFRITPLRISGKDTDSIDLRLQKNVEEQIDKNKGARFIKLGQYNVATYFKTIVQDGDTLTILYWIFEQNQTMITASFTIDANRFEDNDVKREIRHCEKTIETLKIEK